MEHKIDAVVQHMNQLMIRSRTPFIEQYEDNHGNVSWIQRKHKLTDSIVRSHVLGERTIGIYYAGEATKFLVFDIDAHGDSAGQEIRVKGLVYALKQSGIDQKNIHVMFSGMKGYHIQLFWENPLKINSVAAFGRSIVRNLKDYSTGVELRPESLDGRAVKLPLAYHKKSGMTASYVDKYTLQPVPDNLDYFLGIQPMDTDSILVAMNSVLDGERTKRAQRFVTKPFEEYGLETVEQRQNRVERDFSDMKMPVNKKSGLRDKAERLLHEGLPEKGTRHASQFLVALYYKDSNVPIDDAIRGLCDWIAVQWRGGKTNEADLCYLHNEAERCVRYVYGRDDYVGLFDSRGRKPEMTSEDILFAARFKDKNVRKVVWAFLMIGRMYHDSGVFFVPQESVVQITGLSRPTVSKLTKLLVDNGILEVVEEWSYTKRQSRVYLMEHLVEGSTDATVVPVKNNDTVASLFSKTMALVDKVSRDIPDAV